jgi:hypothetical protein
MKKATAIVFIFLLVGLCLWTVSQMVQPRPQTGKVLPKEPPAEATAKEARSTNRPPSRDRETKLELADIDDKAWSVIRELHKELKRQNKPVEFSVRTLDQDEQPVAGAALTATLVRANDKLTLEEFAISRAGEERILEPLILTSDAGGWIRFKGQTGKRVDFVYLRKEGYTVDFPQGVAELNFNPGLRYNSRRELVRDPSDFQRTVTFHLWKKGKTERLIRAECVVRVEPYGTNWYAVNLLSGKTDDFQQADLIFWFQTIKDANGNPARQFHYRVLNGGLMLDADCYPYRAPERGYETDWRWYYEPFGRDADQDHQALLKKRFYVKARNGQIYGAITWHWAAETAVSITGYLNPNGSPNLEPDPEKLITDPEEIRQIDEQTRLR